MYQPPVKTTACNTAHSHRRSHVRKQCSTKRKAATETQAHRRNAAVAVRGGLEKVNGSAGVAVEGGELLLCLQRVSLRRALGRVLKNRPRGQELVVHLELDGGSVAECIPHKESPD
jgi:hypothetical protein